MAPSTALRSKIGALYGPRANVGVDQILADYVGVEALAKLLTEGIDSVTAKDGRLDTKDLAAFVMARMKDFQK
jgi:hypothetical protein